MANIIDGKKIASKILSRVKDEMSGLGYKLGLAVILIGDHWESKLYIEHKKKTCEKVGINFFLHEFPNTVSQKEILNLTDELNNDVKVHGILVQLPITASLDLLMIQEAIDPWKDVDGFSPINQGLLFSTKQKIPLCTVIPPTALGCLKLIESTGTTIEGKKAVIVGRSNIVSKPIAHLLLQKNATITICHSKTQNLEQETKQADILVVAAGQPRLITSRMVKKDVIVIDVGINRVDKNLIGDVDYEEVKEIASFITPVPGGVGPMTISCLMENVLFLAKEQKAFAK